MHIGQVAELTGLSLRTIRHYEEVGLVPASARSQGGFRLYTAGDVERLMVIRRMKPLGFTLEQMRELLRVTDLLQDHAAAGRLSEAELRGCRDRLESFERTARERCEVLRTQARWAEEFAADLRHRAMEIAPAPASPGNR
ncbi:MerR family transcriptional regulator [Streptosporangium sp. NPDC020072]|uniref:MerR family transcriptional regulator n=1 Tax=Streptosporangium sp. NPDC020072 TaxID=3154788 RepID=UPI0034405EA4